MYLELTKRGLLRVVFRHQKKFFLMPLFTLAVAVLYLAMATPLYSASGSMLVKFGNDAVPNLLKPSDPSNLAPPSDADHHEAVLSNIEILQSRALIRDVIEQSGGIEKIYPGYISRYAGRDSPGEAAITRVLKKDLTIKSGLQSDIISVTYLNSDPKVSALFVHNLMNTFIDRRTELYKKPATEFMSEQVAEAQEKLEKSQKALEDFKEKNHISSIDDESSQLTKAKIDAQSIAVSGIDDAQTRLADLQMKERQLLNTYREDAPVVVNLRASIALAEQQLHDRQVDLKSATGKGANGVNVVNGHVAAIDRRIEEIEALRGTFNDLQRQEQIDEDNYKNYLERSEEARVSESLNASKLSSITVVDEPVIPARPSEPQKMLVLFLGVMSGVILGSWFALLFEQLDDRFSTPEEVTKELKVPLLAAFTADPKKV